MLGYQRLVMLVMGLSCYAIALAHADLFTEDGILIEEGQDLYKISGYWTLLININPPRIPKAEFWEAVNQTRQYVAAHGIGLLPEDFHLWMGRLEQMSRDRDIPEPGIARTTRSAGFEYAYPEFTTFKRSKRGFLNGIGKVCLL